jgi:hypothetical protein
MTRPKRAESQALKARELREVALHVALFRIDQDCAFTRHHITHRCLSCERVYKAQMSWRMTRRVKGDECGYSARLKHTIHLNYITIVKLVSHLKGHARGGLRVRPHLKPIAFNKARDASNVIGMMVGEQDP